MPLKDSVRRLVKDPCVCFLLIRAIEGPLIMKLRRLQLIMSFNVSLDVAAHGGPYPRAASQRPYVITSYSIDTRERM